LVSSFACFMKICFIFILANTVLDLTSMKDNTFSIVSIRKTVRRLWIQNLGYYKMNSRFPYSCISQSLISTLLVAKTVKLQNSFKQFFLSINLPEFDKHYSKLQIVFYNFTLMIFTKFSEMKSFLLVRYCPVDLGKHFWSVKGQIHWSKQRSLLAHHNKLLKTDIHRQKAAMNAA